MNGENNILKNPSYFDEIELKSVQQKREADEVIDCYIKEGVVRNEGVPHVVYQHLGIDMFGVPVELPEKKVSDKNFPFFYETDYFEAIKAIHVLLLGLADNEDFGDVFVLLNEFKDALEVTFSNLQSDLKSQTTPKNVPYAPEFRDQIAELKERIVALNHNMKIEQACIKDRDWHQMMIIEDMLSALEDLLLYLSKTAELLDVIDFEYQRAQQNTLLTV